MYDTLDQWYDPAFLGEIGSTDVIIVDGPPGATGPDARYPAVPMIAPKLTPGSLIFLDDTLRESERDIAERWETEFAVDRLPTPKLEKGGVLFRWAGGDV